MNEVQDLKCKTCGGDLNLGEAVNGTVKCKYCGNTYTIPKKETNPASLSFLRQGEHDLDTGKFDDAYVAYKKAAELDETEPEAYWGMALAEFKVQYLKDLVNNRLQPVCSEVTDNYFTANKNYLKALSLATAEQKTIYESRAEEIDAIRVEFQKLRASGLDFDCFICVKVTNENGTKTEDYKDADYIYNFLQDNGFKPFFSERVLRNKTGSDYEAMILYALYTAETMLVVCRNEEYLQTTWVKNEYTRFLKLVNDEEKESDSITFVYHGKPIEKLPGKKGKIQGIDFSLRGSENDILKFVEEHTPLARAKREEEKRRKEQEAEELRRQIEEQKNAQQSLEERLKNLNVNNVSGASSTVVTLLTRVNQELEAKNFDKARQYCETVLERAPENAEAWWKLFLIELRVTHQDAVIRKLNAGIYNQIIHSKNYEYASRYASGDLKQTINEFDKQLQLPQRWWNMFLNDMKVSHENQIIESVSEEKLIELNNNNTLSIAIKVADSEYKERINNFYTSLKERVASQLKTRNNANAEKNNNLTKRISKTQSQINLYASLTKEKPKSHLFTIIAICAVALLVIEMSTCDAVMIYMENGGYLIGGMVVGGLILLIIVGVIVGKMENKKEKAYDENKSLLQKYEQELGEEINEQEVLKEEVKEVERYLNTFNNFEEKYFHN